MYQNRGEVKIYNMGITQWYCIFAAIMISSVCSDAIAGQETEDIQIDITENLCGQNNLALIMQFSDKGFNVQRLLMQLKNEDAPFSFAELEEAAKLCGFQTRLLRWLDVSKATFECPSIIYVKNNKLAAKPNHFLACYGQTGSNWICVGDFPRKPFLISRESLKEIWNGEVLYLAREKASLSAIGEGKLWRYVSVDSLPARVAGVLILIAAIVIMARVFYKQAKL